MPNITVFFYDFDIKRGHRVFNFAVGTANMVDMFSPGSKAVFRDTMNAELDRLELGMKFVSREPTKRLVPGFRIQPSTFMSCMVNPINRISQTWGNMYSRTKNDWQKF